MKNLGTPSKLPGAKHRETPVLLCAARWLLSFIPISIKNKIKQPKDQKIQPSSLFTYKDSKKHI